MHAMSRLLAGLAVFVLFAVAVPTADAQTGKLTGVVTDAQSGVPLEGAQLILQGTGITALTGSNGRYFLVNVPPGTYTVLVRRIGYSSAEVRNVFIQIDVTRNLDAELTPDRRRHHDAAFGTDLHRYRSHRRIVTQRSVGVTTVPK